MTETATSGALFLPFAPTPDRDSAPYWDALARGEFQLQRCRDCGALRWPARALCNRCRSFESDWESFEELGTDVGREHAGRQVFVDHRLDADVVVVLFTFDDRDATAAGCHNHEIDRTLFATVRSYNEMSSSASEG